MGRQLLILLGGDPNQTESSKLLLDDGDLRTLYESLVLTRVVDQACTDLQQSGELGFYISAMPAAASSAGAAIALEDGDWLFPSYRDLGAYLARGGQLEDLLAQVWGVEGDLVRGRQLPGQGGLPDGRFVPPSGTVGASISQAAGVAHGMQLRQAPNVAMAIFGRGAMDQGSFLTGLATSVRHQAPAIFLCRTRGTERPTALQRAAGLGLETALVDGSDCLAVAQTVATARRRALAGEGPVFIEAVLEPESAERDPARRFRGFVEHRGLWDAQREEDFNRRSESRVLDAIETVRGRPPLSSATMLEDVWAQSPWMLQEQSTRLRGGADD
ncbi:MAG: hypothetical protein GKS06_18525 [Acidobacteria bacterium]|nr:hypothetical protein [Acidobacteriota bacterium]